jgi:WhiB family redox-sensing transcriptional regulator
MMLEDWRLRAACRQEDPELFHPIGTRGPALTALAEARRVCDTCTVHDDCLQWAMSHDVDHGVWGGLGEDQRRLLKRRSSRHQDRPSPRADPTPSGRARQSGLQSAGDRAQHGGQP